MKKSHLSTFHFFFELPSGEREKTVWKVQVKCMNCVIGIEGSAQLKQKKVISMNGAHAAV